MRPPESFTPKLVALDLDGTTLRSDYTISPRTKRAIDALQARGVRVILCTGRPARTAKPYAERLGLTEVVILYNGGMVYNYDAGRALACFEFSGNLARETILTLRRSYPGVMCGVETSQGWFVDEARYNVVMASDVPYDTAPDGVGDTLAFLAERVIKLLVWHPEKSVATLANCVAHLPVNRTWSVPGLLEVVGQNVNKRETLKRVATDLGVAQHEVAAFGDQHNDHEMLAWAGYGVAMGNARPEVQQFADCVTLSNDDDGVAAVLEQWV